MYNGNFFPQPTGESILETCFQIPSRFLTCCVLLVKLLNPSERHMEVKITTSQVLKGLSVLKPGAQ